MKTTPAFGHPFLKKGGELFKNWFRPWLLLKEFDQNSWLNTFPRNKNIREELTPRQLALQDWLQTHL